MCYLSTAGGTHPFDDHWHNCKADLCCRVGMDELCCAAWAKAALDAVKAYYTGAVAVTGSPHQAAWAVAAAPPI